MTFLAYTNVGEGKINITIDALGKELDGTSSGFTIAKKKIIEIFRHPVEISNY